MTMKPDQIDGEFQFARVGDVAVCSGQVHSSFDYDDEYDDGYRDQEEGPSMNREAFNMLAGAGFAFGLGFFTAYEVVSTAVNLVNILITLARMK